MKEVDPDNRGLINFQGRASGWERGSHPSGKVRLVAGRDPGSQKFLLIITALKHTCTCHVLHAEFVGIMGRDIREFDNEADLKAAWKVFDKVRLRLFPEFTPVQALAMATLLLVPCL